MAEIEIAYVEVDNTSLMVPNKEWRALSDKGRRHLSPWHQASNYCDVIVTEPILKRLLKILMYFKGWLNEDWGKKKVKDSFDMKFTFTKASLKILAYRWKLCFKVVAYAIVLLVYFFCTK